MTSEMLPVKPDPHTGLPRPPHAPRGYKGFTPTQRPLRKIRFALPPEDTWGPPLEWNVGSRKEGWHLALLGIAILGGFSLFKLNFSFHTSDWPLWVFLGCVTAFTGWVFYIIGSREWLVAGAFWLQKDQTWVSLYDLTEVKAGVQGYGQAFTLTDSSGRTIFSVALWPVQNNQLLWDLIYNGMLYSIRNGTLHPDKRAQRMLSLPAPGRLGHAASPPGTASFDPTTPSLTLPVIPDPQTGLPRPPHAARGYNGFTPTRRPLRKIRFPLPPETAWGPPLEWNVSSRKLGWQAAWLAIAIFGGFALFKLGFSFHTSDWPLWVYLGCVTALAGWNFYRGRGRDWLVVGALWLQDNQTWVSLYELTEVKAGVVLFGQGVTLTDSSGRTLSRLALRSIQNNQLLWDLIHNGMLYSIRNGTLHPDKRAQRVLFLPAA